jgi:hypothetical protein
MFKVVSGVSTCDLGLIALERHVVWAERTDEKVQRGRGGEGEL